MTTDQIVFTCALIGIVGWLLGYKSKDPLEDLGPLSAPFLTICLIALIAAIFKSVFGGVE